MASNVTAGTMTVTIKEDINLNGVARGAKNTLSIANIGQVSRRIITTDGTTLTPVWRSHATADGLDQYHDADVRYVRITNLDNSNFALLKVADAAGTPPTTFMTIRLEPGASHIFMAPGATGVSTYVDISGVTMVPLAELNVTADTAGIDLELFVASAAAS
tara:strand:- start:78 stop:560 length:483 start_codon:yes stop_codon:yes gene_type:complete